MHLNPKYGFNKNAQLVKSGIDNKLRLNLHLNLPQNKHTHTQKNELHFYPEQSQTRPFKLLVTC